MVNFPVTVNRYVILHQKVDFLFGSKLERTIFNWTFKRFKIDFLGLLFTPANSKT